MPVDLRKLDVFRSIDRHYLVKLLGLGTAAVIGIMTSHIIMKLIRQKKRKKKVWQTIHSDSVRGQSKRYRTRSSGRRRWTTDVFPNTSEYEQQDVNDSRVAATMNGSVPSSLGAAGGGDTRDEKAGQHLQRSLSVSTREDSTLLLPLDRGSPVAGAFDDDDDEAVALCNRGLEYLQEALQHWEDALTCVSQPPTHSSIFAITTSDESRFVHKLESLLEHAINLQEECDKLLLVHRKPLVLPWRSSDGVDADAVSQGSRVATLPRSHSDAYLSARSSESEGSFESALDDAVLGDDGTSVGSSYTDRLLYLPLSVAQYQLPLYHCGALEAQHVGVPCRTLRTRLLHCLSNMDFLAKLHALRMAMEVTFQDMENIKWFQQLGREMLAELLIQAERDPKEFLQAFDDLISYVEVPENWSSIQEELMDRQVVYYSFYDIVLDFIVMDAFDDLDNPPSPVTHILQNRWLSNGFKEASLNTAIWTVYKGKRRHLRYPHGFISHFYSVCEQVSAVMAWGFLGPASTQTSRLCAAFKTQTIAFLRDLFSVEKLGYVSLEETGANIMRLAREHGQKLLDDMSEISVQYEEMSLVEP